MSAVTNRAQVIFPLPFPRTLLEKATRESCAWCIKSYGPPAHAEPFGIMSPDGFKTTSCLIAPPMMRISRQALTDYVHSEIVKILKSDLVSLISSHHNHVPKFTCTLLVLLYAAKPASPNSRPIPLCFTPPNGILKSLSCELLIQTIPASILLATR